MQKYNSVEKEILRLVVGQSLRSIEDNKDKVFIPEKYFQEYSILQTDMIENILSKFILDEIIVEYFGKKGKFDKRVNRRDKEVIELVDGYEITFDKTNIIENYKRSLEGKIIGSKDSRILNVISFVMHSAEKDLPVSKQTDDQIINNIKDSFKNNKRLRFVCTFCGRYLKEVIDYKSFIEQNKRYTACNRCDKKSRFSYQDGSIVLESQPIPVDKAFSEYKEKS